MRENHGLQFILDDIDGKLRRNASEIRNVAGNHNFLSELPAAGESWQMRMGDNSLREAFSDYPLMEGDGCIVSRRNRIIRWYPKANGDRLIIDARPYCTGDVIDVIVHGGAGFDGLAFRGINREGNAEDVYSLGRIGKDSAEMVRFVGGGSNIEWNSRWRADGSGSGRGFHAWNKTTALTNISQIQGMQAGDYVVNTYSAAVSILGASRATGDVVQATSETAGVLAGNIRGAAGAQGPRGSTGAAGQTKTIDISINPDSWDSQYRTWSQAYIRIGYLQDNEIIQYSAVAAHMDSAWNGSTSNYNNSTPASNNAARTSNNNSSYKSYYEQGTLVTRAYTPDYGAQGQGYGVWCSSVRRSSKQVVAGSGLTTTGCTATWNMLINSYSLEMFLIHRRTSTNIIGQSRLQLNFFGNNVNIYTGTYWVGDFSEIYNWGGKSLPNDDVYEYSDFGYYDKRHPHLMFSLFT